MISTDLIKRLLTKYVGSAARAYVENKMTAAIPKIAAGMTAKGMTLDHVPPKLVVHDALFRLWRAVIHSGDIADLIRDSQDAGVWQQTEKLMASQPPPSIEQVVEWVKTAALTLVFGQEE